MKNNVWIRIITLWVLLTLFTLSCKRVSAISQEDTGIPIIYSAEVAKVEKEEGIEVVDAMLTPGSEITFQGYYKFQQEYLSDTTTYDPKYFTRMVEITITDSTIQDRSYFFEGQVIRPNYQDFPDKKGEYIKATVRVKKRLIDQKTFRGYIVDKVINLTPLRFDSDKVLATCIRTLEANTERLKKEIPERIPKDWLERTPQPFKEREFFNKQLVTSNVPYPDVMLDFRNKKAICRFLAKEENNPTRYDYLLIYLNVVIDLETALPQKLIVNFVVDMYR